MAPDDNNDSKDKGAWHRGYLDTRSVTSGIVGSIIAALLLTGVLSPVWSAISHWMIWLIGSISRETIDGFYARLFNVPLSDAILNILLSTWSFFAIILYAWAIVRAGVFYIRAGESAKAFRHALIHTVACAVLIFISASLLFFQANIFDTAISRVTVLAPELTDHEQKVFLARFVTIHGKADFDRIMHDMEAVATERHVVLPKRTDF